MDSKQYLATELVALLCALALAIAFLFLPWADIQGTQEAGAKVLWDAQSTVKGGESLLWLVPLAAVMGALAAIWGMREEQARQAAAIITLVAGLIALVYFIILFLRNINVLGDTFEDLGVGFWLGLLASIGLAVQYQIPRTPTVEQLSLLEIGKVQLREAHDLLILPIRLVDLLVVGIGGAILYALLSETPSGSYVISPQLLIFLATAIGVGVLGYVFRGAKRWFVFGLGLGAAAGAAGSALFMKPLNYCTFEAERTSTDAAIGYVLVAVGVAIIVMPVAWVANKLLRRESLIGESQHTQGTFKQWWIALPLLLPTLTILALFLYYPFLETLRLSSMLSRLGARREVFICVDNFTRLIDDPVYFDIVKRTMFMSFFIIVGSMGLSLLIATMAYLPIRGASIYRVLLVWPYAMSPAVAGIIFLLMFNPSGGLINYLMGNWFGIKLGWLNDPDVAPWTIIIASVWKSMGFNILFYIAGLQNVPQDLIEAGAIDGAGVLRRFWHIVWPLLSPTTFFLIVTNMTYAFFETYATIDYLTPGGGPLQSTTTMMYRVIQLGVGNNDMGKAAAQSVVLFLTVIGITLVLFRTGERQVTYGA